MRPLEFLWLGSSLLSPCLDLLSFPTSLWIPNSLMAGTLAAQLAVEGYRWQMVPSLVSLPLIVLPQWTIVLLLRIALCFLSALLCILFPIFQTDRPNGPYTTATVTTEWSDKDRPMWDLFEDNIQEGPRRLPIRIWYPIDHDICTDASLAKPAEYLPFMQERAAIFAAEVHLPGFLSQHFNHIFAHSMVSLRADRPLPLANTHKPLPVVFFSHGFCSSSDFSTGLFEVLASFGFVVVAVEHTFDAAITHMPSTKSFARFNAVIPSYIKSEDAFWKFRGHHLLIRTQDVQFAADCVESLNRGEFEQDPELARIFNQRLDTSKFTVMGHSFGGGTAANACILDKRFKGALGLDAWVTTLSPKFKKTGTPVPLRLLQAEEFITGIGDGQFYTETNQKDCEDIVRNSVKGSAMYRIRGVKHQDFLDLPIYSPAVTRFLGISGPHGLKLQRIISRHALDFLEQLGFDEHLGGELKNLPKLEDIAGNVPIWLHDFED